MTSMNRRRVTGVMLALAGALAASPPEVQAGPLLDRLKAQRQAKTEPGPSQGPMAEQADQAWADLPPGVRVVRDVPYGSDAAQRFDVYLPTQPVAAGAPVIFMVHGGGWRWGSKSHSRVVQNKVTHWVPQGYVFISVDYRMLPEANPLQQAQDVAHALAVAQKKAADWGGDARQFILMGHSAGAHLVSLLTTDLALTSREGVRPWLGTVSLDSATFNVVATMEGRHFRLYDNAFGADATFWPTVSPHHVLQSRTVPLLAVCSSRRSDSCPQARQFALKAQSLGSQVVVLPKDMSHGDINERLGQDPAYTAEVDVFLRQLTPPPRP